MRGGAPAPPPPRRPRMVSTRPQRLADRSEALRVRALIDTPVSASGSYVLCSLQQALRATDNPVILVFSGGGFQQLAIDLDGSEACDWMAARGVTCILAKYRVPDSNHIYDKACGCGVTPRHLTALEDAQRAIGLVRSRASAMGVDPDRIGVIDLSAGGYRVAQTSNILRPAYPQVDAFDRISSRPDFAIAHYSGHLCRPGSILDPGIRVTQGTPPTFLVQSWDDPTDEVRKSTVYAWALDAAGVPSEVHLFPRGVMPSGSGRRGNRWTGGRRSSKGGSRDWASSRPDGLQRLKWTTAKAIRARILEVTGLTASAGSSYNRFLAKLASDHRKPNGQFVVTPDMGADRVATLPISRLHRVGPVTAKRMHALGIETGADLRDKPLEFLQRHFGSSAEWYHAISRGIEHRPVNPNRERKSCGRRPRSAATSPPTPKSRPASCGWRTTCGIVREAAGVRADSHGEGEVCRFPAGHAEPPPACGRVDARRPAGGEPRTGSARSCLRRRASGWSA